MAKGVVVPVVENDVGDIEPERYRRRQLPAGHDKAPVPDDGADGPLRSPQLRPESRGYVRIKGPDPFAKPAIQPDYLSTPGDRKIAAESIRLTRRIVAQPALQKYAPEEIKPGVDLQSDEELAAAAGDIGTTIFHPVGTCKMGSDDMAVVDERLRVRGLKGLRVVDASVMPTITSGNTNSPVIMIAEKASDMIREDAKAG